MSVVYCKKDKNWITSKTSFFLLLMMNIFLFSSLILHWYSSHQIKDNFNDFSKQVKEELRNFSKLASKVEGELQNIQKEIKGLNKTIEELNAIERELKNITTGLAELEKTGEEIKGTGENIKGSLDNLGEIKEKIDELIKLEVPLIELEKSLIKGGQGLEKEIKEKIGGLIAKINELKKIACPSCFNWNFKLSSYNSISNNIFEEIEWKKLFKDGNLIISGQLETVKYEYYGIRPFRRLVRTVLNKKEKKDITITQKEEIKGWKDKEEQKTNGEEKTEFIFEEAHCKDCGRKLDLKNFSIKKLREEII